MLPFTEYKRKNPRPSAVLENPQTIGEHIKRERQLRGLRQCDVATELGVNTFTICNWENGQAVGRPRYYPIIIDWLEYDPFPEPQTIGQKLLQDRLRLGLTSQEMAQRNGVDQSVILKGEKSRRRI